MNALWDALLHALESMPAWLAAVLIGWGISVGVTQTVKFWMPLRWDPYLREDVARGVAVMSASFPALLYAMHRDQPALIIMLTATGAGLWSPLAFALLQAALKRYWPWAADVLSQDVRGHLVGKSLENRP